MPFILNVVKKRCAHWDFSAAASRAFYDGQVAYFKFENCPHILCNAHHLCELRFIFEQYQQSWSTHLFNLLLDIKKEVAMTSSEQMNLPPE